MNMVVAYQSPGATGMHGSIISYETVVEFAPEGARFVALDKTPILGNTNVAYETSWSTNRVLARVHADLGGIGAADGRLRAALGNDVRRVAVQASAPEGSSAFEALLTSVGGDPADILAVRLAVTDDVAQTMPVIGRIEPLAAALPG